MREKERECRAKGWFDRLQEGWFVRKGAILLCAKIEPQSQEEEDESLPTSAKIIFFSFFIIFLFEIVI